MLSFFFFLPYLCHAALKLFMLQGNDTVLTKIMANYQHFLFAYNLIPHQHTISRGGR